MKPDCTVVPARSAALSAGRLVVMLGVDPKMKGGVASMLQVYRQVGFGRRVPMAWITAAGEGSRWHKLAGFVAAIFKLSRLGLGRRVAVAHLMMSTGGRFWRKSILIRICRAFGIPALLHIHSGRFDRFFDDSPGWRRLYIRQTLAAASRVLVLGDYWANRLRPIVPTGRLLTISNGVLLPPRPAVNVGTREGRDTLLFLGRLVARKGIFEVIAAFGSIADEYPGLLLVLGGDGDPRAVHDAVYRLPTHVRPRVVIAGWIDAAAQADWLRRSLALLLPSHVENLPMCVLEAQAHVVPVVATPVGAVPETVIDGVTGRLIPVGDVNALADATRQRVTGGGSWEAMSRAARRHIEHHFAAETTVARLESLYSGYLAGPPRQRHSVWRAS